MTDTELKKTASSREESYVSTTHQITPEWITFQSRKTAMGQDTFLAPSVIKFANQFCERVPTNPPRWALDYGCGNRFNGRKLQERGYHTVFYDVNQFRRYYGAENQVLFESTTTLPEGVQFERVLLNYVLNVVLHETRKQILTHIKQIATPDALILVEVRGVSQVSPEKYAKWTPFEDGFLSDHHTFQKGFTPLELVTLVRSQGFKLLHVLHAKGEKVSIVVTPKETAIQPHTSAIKLLTRLQNRTLTTFLPRRRK